MLSVARPGGKLSSRLWRRLIWGRYPTVRQYDQVDCGPAALLSVLRYWGGDASLVRIRELTHTDARGSTMLSLVHAAESLGFEACGATGEYEDLAREALPCIAHVVMPDGLHHFVVVYQVRRSSVLLGDPGRGLRRISHDDFLSIWPQRAVVLLKPARDLFAQPVRHWIAWVAGYLRDDTTALAQSVFLGAAYTTFWLATSLFVKWLVDDFIPHRNLRGVVLTAGFLFLLTTLRATAGFLRQRFLIGLSQRSSVAIAGDFLQHVYGLPARFFETRRRGDITARINDSVQIQTALVRVVGLAVVDVLVILGAVAFTFAVAPIIGWLVLAALPLYGLLLASVTRALRGAQNEVSRHRSEVESNYIDTLTGIEEIRGYGVARVFSLAAEHLYRVFQERGAALATIQARTALYAELTGGVLVIAALGVGAWSVVGGSLQLGEMLAAYSLLAGALPSVARCVDVNAAIQSASVAATRLNDLLLAEREDVAGVADRAHHAFRIREGLRLENATFTWPRGKTLFESVSMSIERGAITALRGPSGSGKSTIVKVLQRTYPLSAGTLWVDSVPANDVQLDSYRANVAVLRETTRIFNLPLAANITLGRSSIPQQVGGIEELALRLGFGDFLRRFEFGLATPLGEDARQLSTGERQVVGLLRALLGEPAVLVVDEGVNGVDATLAPLVRNALLAYARDHAVLVISHEPRVLGLAQTVYSLRHAHVELEHHPSTAALVLGRTG
jgi:ABC-type bacteriocin/lantibiotic exporter with double-glycine peptidase domain